MKRNINTVLILLSILLFFVILLLISHKDSKESFSSNDNPKVCFYYSQSPKITDSLSGGEYAILKFLKLLNARGIKSALYSADTQTGQVPFTNKISDETVVVYSEEIKGNPLQATKVGRWMLYNPYMRGGQELIDTWNKDDVLISYGNYDCGLQCDIRVDVVEFNEDKFDIKNRPETKTKKYYIIHKAMKCGWTQESLDREVDRLKMMGFEEFRIESAEIMNEKMPDCSVMVSFDVNTYVSNIAVLCGALSMIKKSETDTRSYEDIIGKRGSYGSIGIKPFDARLLEHPYNYEERLRESNQYREYIKTANNIDEFVKRFSLE
jgi:hypothetical protein